MENMDDDLKEMQEEEQELKFKEGHEVFNEYYYDCDLRSNSKS